MTSFRSYRVRYRLLVGIKVRGGLLNRCVGVAAVAVIALGACAAEAGARVRLRPRIGPAMGIIPPVGEQQEIAIGSNLPVVYHGGQVMRGPVRIHTVFWAPPGYRFTGSPGPGILGYQPMIEQFVADSASDSDSLGNVFSVLREYPDRFGSGQYALNYRPLVDSIDDRRAYPPRSKQCASPSGIATCVTDLEVQRELGRLIGRQRARGLGDLWFVFLPPNVDTCLAEDACGSNDFAGYHSLSNSGHGPVIYSIIVDPLIEVQNIPGADPRGNPEAESSIDTVAHEAVEAITDPKGVGWMDPNGFEVADKCEDGPQVGTPLGSAPNGSVYNQLIGGHQYLIQGMWSNTRQGCVTRSRSTRSPLPLASVSLDQFSSLVRGRIGKPHGGVSVRVSLSRAGRVVARGSGRTRADGSWGPVSLGAHAVGDDRDLIVIRYGRGGRGGHLIQRSRPAAAGIRSPPLAGPGGSRSTTATSSGTSRSCSRHARRPAYCAFRWAVRSPARRSMSARPRPTCRSCPPRRSAHGRRSESRARTTARARWPIRTERS